VLSWPCSSVDPTWTINGQYNAVSSFYSLQINGHIVSHSSHVSQFRDIH
jgi:hypothetical protein